MRCICSGSGSSCQRADAPRIGEKRGRHAEADDVGERVELFAEFAIGAHGARHASVQRIENDGDADGARGVVKIRGPAFESGQNGVIAAKQVCYGKDTREDIDAAAQAVIAEKSPRFFFVADRI